MLATTLSIARKHQQEGRKPAALTTFSDFLFGVVSHAVCTTSSADAGIALLHDLGVTSALREFAALNGWALAALQSGPVKSAVINDPTLVCLAWFCGESECAAVMLEAIRSANVRRHFPLTGFWQEFATGLLCLADHEPYNAPTLKAKGYERYLMPYLSLIADLSQNRDTKTVLAEVDQAFQARNRDKRLLDWRTIDGDGKKPVQWDFRRETLLRYKGAA